MSNGNTIALALGLGGGALIWHVTRDRVQLRPAPGATTTLGGPPRAAAPCSLRLDAAGLTVDGTRAEVAAAVERCKANGRADVALASDAPAAIHVQLVTALSAAGVPFTLKVA